MNGPLIFTERSGLMMFEKVHKDLVFLLDAPLENWGNHALDRMMENLTHAVRRLLLKSIDQPLTLRKIIPWLIALHEKKNHIPGDLTEVDGNLEDTVQEVCLEATNTVLEQNWERLPPHMRNDEFLTAAQRSALDEVYSHEFSSFPDQEKIQVIFGHQVREQFRFPE